MRTLVGETIIYEYNELSESAKEKVREANSAIAWQDSYVTDNIFESAKDMLAEVGLELGELEYDLYSRGGRPRFSCTGSIGEDFHVTTRLTRWHAEVDWHVGDYEYADDAQPEVGAIFIRALLTSLSDDIFKVAREEDEYVSSDEYAAELAAANDYEYDEDGDLI